MRAISHEEFCKRVLSVHGEAFDILGEYKNRRTKILTRHNVCGHVWEVLPESLANGHGCPKCTGNQKKTTKEFIAEVVRLVGDEYSVYGEYKSTHGKMTFRHRECGHTFEMVAKAFLMGQRCPKCKLRKLSKMFRKTTEQFRQEVREKVGDEYIVLSEYKAKDIEVKMLHAKCGEVFSVTPNHFLSSMRSRCPRCKQSKGEDVIERYLKQRGYLFKRQYRLAECKNKRPLPFDFAIFEGDNVACLIEFDGEQHFIPKFGTKEFERTKRNDEIKNNFCNLKGIPLIRIPYNADDIESTLHNSLKSMKIPSRADRETVGRCND